MALEEAGISLQAENFNKYIKQLDTINKAQQEIFNVASQKTGKTVDEVSRAYKGFESQLNKNIATQKRAQQEARKLAETQKIAAATRQQALISAGQATIRFIQLTGQAVIESSKLAAQFEGQQIGLENLAASFGQSGNAIKSAIQGASKGTLSGLQAINAANQGLLLGVAKTPEEFANLTNSALTLGRTLGLDATQSIEQFTSALGRQSLLILDNFGISAKQVNAEIERLAQADFGVARSELTEAQKQATFMKAALNIAGKSAATIGEEAGKAQASFDRLNAQAEDLKVTFGALTQPLGTGIADALARAGKTAQQFFAFLGAGFTATSTIATGVFNEFATALSRLGQLVKGEISFAEFNEPLREFSDILDEAGIAATDRFKEIASTIQGVNFPNDEAREFAQNLDDQNQQLEEAKINLEGYQSALKQAESLQLSFARAAEDSALRLARTNEDIARKQGRQVTKLEEGQAKDRDKLLKNQIKQREKFEADSKKQIGKAEADIAKEQKKAGEKRKADQQKLQRELQQAQEKFNLSRLQSERRFNLQDRRLRASGDILALQELRENRDLERQEETENFGQAQKERKQSADEQQREQAKDLQERVNELKSNLEDQRAELLASFDEQLVAQQQSQQEAKLAQQQAFRERAEDRVIQLQREEEDRRISQGRQLEDLGRSFAEQENVTAEGTAAIANRLENVFGIDGTADNIISGFAAKSKNEFTTLFEDLEEIVKNADMKIEAQKEEITSNLRSGTSGGFGSRLGGVQEFNEGGIVGGPGPIGSPQLVVAHKGETAFAPTHQQSFSMNAPVIPSQNLNVNMSGGFDIRGGEQAGEQATQKAITEMTDAFEIVVKRLGRQV